MTGEQNLGGPVEKPATATDKFRVLLPIEIDGKVYGYGQEIELDMETAKQYAHALVRVESKEAK